MDNQERLEEKVRDWKTDSLKVAKEAVILSSQTLIAAVAVYGAGRAAHIPPYTALGLGCSSGFGVILHYYMEGFRKSNRPTH